MPKGKIIKTSKGEFKKVDTDKFEKIGKPGRTINSFAMSMIKEDAQDKSEKNYSNYFKKMDKNKLEEFVKEALKNPKKADLNKDNKLSDYEKARATAIEKSIDKVDEIKERILRELRGNVNEMAGEDLELKSLAKKMIPTLKKLGFEVEYSTDTSMKTLKNAGDKFVALRVQDGMLGAHIPFKAGLDAAKEIQKEIQKSLGNKFEYKLTKSKRGPGLEFYTILIRNK